MWYLPTLCLHFMGEFLIRLNDAIARNSFFRYVCSMYAYKVFRQLVSNSPALRTAHIHIDFINLSIIYLFPLLTPFLFSLVSILGLKMSSAFFKLNSVLARIIWHWFNLKTHPIYSLIYVYTISICICVSSHPLIWRLTVDLGFRLRPWLYIMWMRFQYISCSLLFFIELLLIYSPYLPPPLHFAAN